MQNSIFLFWIFEPHAICAARRQQGGREVCWEVRTDGFRQKTSRVAFLFGEIIQTVGSVVENQK